MATLDRGCAAAHMLAYSCCRASSSSLRCRLRRNRPTCSGSIRLVGETSHLSCFIVHMAPFGELGTCAMQPAYFSGQARSAMMTKDTGMMSEGGACVLFQGSEQAP